jgi:hypothetical protein
MAGLGPAIHVFLATAPAKKDADARHKAGHDESGSDAPGAARRYMFFISRYDLENLAGLTEKPCGTIFMTTACPAPRALTGRSAQRAENYFTGSSSALPPSKRS